MQSKGSTLTRLAAEIGITTPFAAKLIAEGRVELDPGPPSGDDLRLLARRL